MEVAEADTELPAVPRLAAVPSESFRPVPVSALGDAAPLDTALPGSSRSSPKASRSVPSRVSSVTTSTSSGKTTLSAAEKNKK